MAAQNFEKFVKIVSENKALAENLQKVSTNLDAVIKLGKEQGCDFTAEDIKAYHDQHGGELSDEQLENVAGGIFPAVMAVTAVVIAATMVAGNLRA